MRISRRRNRLLGLAAAVMVCAGGFGASLAVLGAGAAVAAGGTLDIFYTTPTTIQVKLADGTVVGSGSTVPAGSYTVIVYDPNADTNPQLAINGPGVSLSSNLDSTGMGIDQPATFGPYTFQTSASYSVEDTNLGASTLISFNTSATAGGSGGSTGPSTVPSSTTPSGGGTSTGMTTPASKPPATSKSLGTLVGSVAGSGKLALSLAGRPVRALKPGLYTVTLGHHPRTVELIIGTGSKPRLTLSGTTSSATHGRTVTLRAGKWWFEPSVHGPKTSFAVT